MIFLIKFLNRKSHLLYCIVFLSIIINSIVNNIFTRHTNFRSQKVGPVKRKSLNQPQPNRKPSLQSNRPRQKNIIHPNRLTHLQRDIPHRKNFRRRRNFHTPFKVQRQRSDCSKSSRLWTTPTSGGALSRCKTKKTFRSC